MLIEKALIIFASSSGRSLVLIRQHIENAMNSNKMPKPPPQNISLLWMVNKQGFHFNNALYFIPYRRHTGCKTGSETLIE